MLLPGADIAETSLHVAIIALATSTIAALITIVEFILHRVRIPHVRYVGNKNSFGQNMVETRTFTVDVVNWGASIHHLEVWIRIFVPPWIDKEFPKNTGNFWIYMPPVGKQSKTMETGEAQEFVLDAKSLMHPHPGGVFDGMAHHRELLKNLPRRYVSLCIFSNGRRRLLKRLKSWRFHYELDCFFDAKRKWSRPVKIRLAGLLFRFQHGKDGKGEKSERIRKALDKWRPHYFDFQMEKLCDWLAGRKESPDRERPQAIEDERGKKF